MYRIAIVGRPNVGKSTLFNRLTRSRRALVGDQPGMTRDRLFQNVEWKDRVFELIDTGGIDFQEQGPLQQRVIEQVEYAIDDASLILFVVDGRAGITPLDSEINLLLKKRGKAYFVVVNKIDVPELASESFSFYSLGAADVFPISAEHKLGVEELLDQIIERVPESEALPDQDEIRIAVIGRPNVGKSSLVNKLAGQDRVIVSQEAGTTRDAVDTLIRRKDQRFRLIDTAGIRRKGRTEKKTEKLSVIMARKHVARSDVALLLIDPLEGATKLDAAIASYAHDAGTSVILVINKWDLVEKETDTARHLEKEFRSRMRFLDYAPMKTVSALSGQRVQSLLKEVVQAYQARQTRIATPELNRFLEKEVPGLFSSRKGERKSLLKYACQVAVAPPTLVLFLRGREKLHFSRERNLVNRLREKYNFYATPIRIHQRTPSKRRSR